MTRAAHEPQLDAPVEDRLGYLAHVSASLEVMSPDSLHGAAHLAPLTGLELPFLDLLADLNDAALAAGSDADLDELDRVVACCRQRVELEASRLAGNDPAASREASREERLELIRWQGEAMTAEIVLEADAPSLRGAVTERLRRLLAEQGAVPAGGTVAAPDPAALGSALSDPPTECVAALVVALGGEGEQERTDAACERAHALVGALGLAPLRDGWHPPRD